MRRTIALALWYGITAAAAELPSVSQLLERTGRRTEQFWEHIGAITCLEHVSQARLSAGGKVSQQREAVFEYQVFLQLAGNDLTVEESRVAQGQKDGKGAAPLLTTAGFTTLQLIFHPYYQASFEFEAPEDVDIEGHRLWLVRFRHVNGARSPSAMSLRGQEFPLSWRGTAWIEPASGEVVRVSVSLPGPMEDIGLLELRGDVHYAPVTLAGARGSYWLPSLASIEAKTQRQHWRNAHRFLDYKLFSVTTDARILPDK